MRGGSMRGGPARIATPNSRFVWTWECEEVFVKLKEYLASPPVLCKQELGTPIRLYFPVTEKA